LELLTDDSAKLLSDVYADVVVLTTTSSLEEIRPQVMEIVSHGKNVVSTCEELMYPWLTNPSVAREIDSVAKEHNVSVLSTGVNPGFLMDFLPLAMTGICRDVKKVTVERVQDAQFRRVPFQKKIGAGLTVGEFEEKVKEGNLRHVGLTESLHLVASRLRWELDRTEDIVEPVISTQPVVTENRTIEPGRALGVNQIGRAYVDNKEVITLVFRASIGEPDPRDRILIQGNPDIDMAIRKGVNGDTATCAIIVNAIPVVIQAPPGLRTMADITPISFFK
jgi:4-hydroxy-tetrahydrodipicolinate reductase